MKTKEPLTLDEAGAEEMAKDALLLDSEMDELIGELPPGVCPACMGLSPGIAIDGETIMHCPVCHDTGRVTPEEAERYWKAVEEREKTWGSEE